MSETDEEADTITLLKSWDLEENIIQRFKENGIQKSHLKELTDDILRELCPKISTRLDLKNKINEFLTAETKTSTVPTVSEVDPDIEEKFVLEAISCRPPFPDFDLKTLLSTSPTGNSILTYYDTHNQLTNKHRNNLTDVISRRIFTRVVNHRINHEEYNILTAKIIALFPTENAGTYFVPPVKKRDSISGKPGFARGKLVDKIRNTLYISGERKRKATAKGSPDKSKRAKNLEDLEETYKDDVIWLKNNCEPWEDVINKWKSSFELRQLQQFETVGEFIKYWPTLNDTKSDVLIHLDFDRMYGPDKTNSLHIKWCEFMQKIEQIKNTVCNDENTKTLSNNINKLTDNDDKLPLQIKLLCRLVPPKGRLNRRQKFSIAECIDSFIVDVKTPGDIQTHIDKLASVAASEKKTVQPYIIRCSTDSTGGPYYLIIDKVRYVYQSAYKAIDTLFKCYHTLHVSYPNAGYHLYLLIQKCVYNISTKYDVIPPYISDLVSNAKC